MILRCLHPDPRQRPASALAVAAALPGGDPLAAALAAGETPSPDLVAAAGETDGLEPKVAVAWLAAALVLIAAAMIIGPRVCITSKLNLENSPEALTRDARNHIRNFGYTAKPADSAWGLEYTEDYKAYTASHPKEADARWQNPAAGQPPLIHFWYRESPQPLSAKRQFHVSVDYDDPPFDQSGMLRLETDPDGKLIGFEAVPPQVEKPAPPAAPFDWNKLFLAAGLDPTQFQTTEPTWTPLANWDTRAAWTGTDPATGAKLRIEAAAWRGRPVFYRIIGPWTVAGPHDPALQLVFLALHRNHLYCAPRRQRPGLAQCSPRTRRPARGHPAEPHLFPLSGVRQTAADAPYGHARGNRQLLDLVSVAPSSTEVSSGSSMRLWSPGCGASGRAR